LNFQLKEKKFRGFEVLIQLFEKCGKIYKCYYMKGVRIFQREKKKKIFTFFLRLISAKRRRKLEN
jgi:hypothetical protein